MQKKFFCISGLNYLALSHNCNSVSMFSYNAKIMCNQQNGHLKLLLKLTKKLKNLCLYCHIECSSRFVCN